MDFKRMGEVNLSDLVLHPLVQQIDGSYLSFELLNIEALNRAHFYDEIRKTHIDVYVTYMVQAQCLMKSGHVVTMDGYCTPNEYQTFKELYQEEIA